MREEEIKNAKFRRRMLLLMPFNGLCIFGTMKYCANIQKIANRFWPKMQKVKISNLFLVATSQAIMFSTIYLGGTCAILGENPVRKYREMVKINEELYAKFEEVEKSGAASATKEVAKVKVDTLPEKDQAFVKGLNKIGISNEMIMDMES